MPKCPSAKCPFSTCHQPYSANIRPPSPPSCVLPHPPVPQARHRQRAIPFFDAFPLLIFAFAPSQEKIFARISATASCDRPRRHSPIRYSVIIKSTAQHRTARRRQPIPNDVLLQRHHTQSFHTFQFHLSALLQQACKSSARRIGATS